MDNERFEELKHSGSLPSPSGVGLRILVLTQSDDFLLKDIVETIKTDPALTGRMIHLASSVAKGGLVPVTTAEEAAMRLGTKAVCHLALGFSLISGSRSGKCRSFDYDQFWTQSLATAVAARMVSERLGAGTPSEAFTLGLLQGIGRLALASVHPEEYEDVQRMLREDPTRELVDVETEHLYIDHRSVAAAMLEEWKLPGHFSEAALYANAEDLPTVFEHVETEPMLRVLRVASAMAEICTMDPNRQVTMWPETRAVCDAVGMPFDTFAEVFDLAVEEWESWGEMLKIPTDRVLPSAELEERFVSARCAEEDAAPPPSSLRVLAVDDDPVSLRLLVSLLERRGHDVITATNGREALAAYAERGAQVVITDWMMPEMDGLQLCRQLRRTREGRKLYILLLTGRTEEERIVEAFEVGADDYIVKPFKPELLSARIQPAIRVIQLQEDHDRQVREKERLNRQLDIEKRKFKAAAMTDSLTELPNRRYAMKRLEKEWANSQRTNSTFSVIMLDIDHFKRVNDDWGHDVGDVVLRSTARSIQRVLRRGDTCARMGGEEFLVICPNTSTEEGLQRLAERIREAIETSTMRSGAFEGHVTVSLGAALRTREVESIDVLLKMADEAVYEAKRGGRNRVVLGRPPRPGRRSA